MESGGIVIEQIIQILFSGRAAYVNFLKMEIESRILSRDLVKNSLFSGALKLRHINRVSIMSGNQLGEEDRLLEDLNERIRALRQSPEGWIYFSTDSGKIYRLRPAK